MTIHIWHLKHGEIIVREVGPAESPTGSKGGASEGGLEIFRINQLLSAYRVIYRRCLSMSMESAQVRSISLHHPVPFLCIPKPSLFC
jgi:hypothetical protein